MAFISGEQWVKAKCEGNSLKKTQYLGEGNKDNIGEHGTYEFLIVGEGGGGLGRGAS